MKKECFSLSRIVRFAYFISLKTHKPVIINITTEFIDYFYLIIKLNLKTQHELNF
jgi:hypothetical protein